MATGEKSSTGPQEIPPAAAGQLDPAAMTAGQAAALLQVEERVVLDHLAAGLPAGPDGRIHLVMYTAWLLARLAGSE